MTQWIADTAQTPLGFLALAFLTIALFCGLVIAGAWVRGRVDRYVKEREEHKI